MTLPNSLEVSRYDQNRFLAYPHNNGFADGGESLLLGEYDGEGYFLVKVDLASGADIARSQFPIKRLSHSAPTFDIALDSNRLFYVANNAVWTVDLETSNPEHDKVYQSDLPLGDIMSISRDASRALVFAKQGDGYGAFEIDIATGRAAQLFHHPWWVGHLHYCPHDETLIGFCHEGQAAETRDRVWLYRTSGGTSECLFDQGWDDLSTRLHVGHERWAFHDGSVVMVAYGHSDGTPRGVHEAFADGRPSRLVSESDRDFHVDISRDGRWVVVDTTGPHDLPGRGWENAGAVSDVVLIDYTTGAREWLARSTESHLTSHTHPVFSPDGKWIFYHQTNDTTTNWRVMKVKNPWVE